MQTAFIDNKEMTIEYNIFSSCMESNAAFEMQLLEVIHAYNTGCLTDIPLDVLNQEADKVYREEPDINSYGEERIKELFSIEEYDKQRLILELIYYIVGKRWTAQSNQITLEKLDHWGDAVMRYGFYKGLNLTRDDILRLIEHINNDPKYIEDNSRDVNYRRKEYAKRYQDLFGINQTEDEIIEKIHPDNDGAYTELPESVTTMVHCSIKNEWFDLWLAIYDLLGYAPLQGRIIYDLKTIEQVLGAILVEKDQHTTRRKIFAHMLSNRAFELFINQQDLLERNTQNNYFTPSQLKKAQEGLRNWKEHKNEYINGFVDLLLGTFSTDEVLSWLSKKERNAASKRGVYKERDLSLIHDIWTAIQTQKEIVPIDVEKSDLNTLLAYVYNVDIAKLSKDTCGKIIRAICKHIYTDEHMYIGWDFSDESIGQMRAVYSCLEKSGLSGIGLAQSNIPITEGYNATIDKHFRLQFAHKVWLSVLMLQAEASDDPVNEFAWNEKFMFECAYKLDVDMMDYYMLPCLIGEAVVLQITKEHGKEWLKDKYEEKLIDTINDLMLVIIVLSLNEGNISDANKQKVTQRLNKEWDTAVAMNPRNPNIKICEQYIMKL